MTHLPSPKPRSLAPQARRRPTPARSRRSWWRRVSPDSGETRSFASDLLSRLPRGGGAGTRPVSQHKRDEREAAAIAARNRTYAMLEDDDEPASAPAPAPASAKASKDERRRAKRVRRARGDDSDEDETAVAARERALGSRAGVSEAVMNEDEEDSEARAARVRDEARAADLEERDAFAERLRARDEGKTRKLTERRLTEEEKMEEERRAKRTGATADERDALVPDLRKVSREEYLKKREAQKLEELKDSIEDEKYLFEGVELTEQERRDIEYRREVYELATQQVRDIDSIMEDRYRLPASYDESGKEGQDKRFRAALERYKDPDADDANPNREQEAWEKHQINKATTRYGAADRAPGETVRSGV